MLQKLLAGIIWIGNFLQSPLLLLIRLYWGYKFTTTGFGKLINLMNVADYFQSLGIPFPVANTLLAGSTEMLCGALLLLGLFARIASIPLIGVMTVAFLTAGRDSLVSLLTDHDPSGFFQETPFLFAYAALLVFCFGPGKLSLDYWLSRAYKNKEMP
jgi:putative oxidoreductase